MVWNPKYTMAWIPESRGRDPESRSFMDSLTWGEKEFFSLLAVGTRIGRLRESGCKTVLQFNVVFMKINSHNR